MSNKFSDWLRIDLHIHTDKSRETKTGDYKGNFSVTTLKEKLITNHVEIFSLTDHNIININAYEEYYDNYTDSDPLLLLGVELDIQGSDKTYHTLLIFDYTTKEKAKEISDNLEAKYNELGITDKFSRILQFEHLIELFPNDDFFFIPHAKKGGHQSIVDATISDIEDTQKMILLMPSALEKVTKQEMKDVYQKGFDSLQTDSFQEKKDIAYINFSDNHYIEQYPCKHNGDRGNHEFDYIKGYKNYETLRLAFVDPESRIKTQLEYNAIDRTLHTIDSLKIEDDTLLNENMLHFSPHLNVIIGGRSSGKSMLMHILGKKIEQPLLDDKYPIDTDKITIKSSLDMEYKNQISINSNLIYINQGDIVNYFEDKNLYDLAKKSNKQFQYDNAKDLFEQHKKLLLTQVSNLIHSYKDLYEYRIVTYELHQSTIENILSEHFILNYDYESLLGQFNKLNELEEAKLLADNLYDNIINFKDNPFINIEEDEKPIIEDFEKLVDKKRKSILSIKSSNQKQIDFINAINYLIDGTKSRLDSDANQKISSKESLISLKQNIKEHFKRVVRLKKEVSRVENFNYAKQEAISINDDVDLVLEVEMEMTLKDVLLDCLNGAKSNESLYLNLLSLFNNTISIKNYPNDTSSEALAKKFNTQLKYVYVKLDTPEDYLIYGESDTSKSNSPGFNSEKYLEIILKNTNNKMILIDQPEDNLGNKFISDKLVSIFREIKFTKQIFLVTHNPSIVVYGDAESIILAEHDGKITYKQISLEDKEAQKEICSVLDGGEYIFNNRSKKYNIQRILKEGESNE